MGGEVEPAALAYETFRSSGSKAEPPVEAASDVHPPLPPRMADLYDKPERVTRIANDLAALESHIREQIAN